MAIQRTTKLGLPIIPESEYSTTKVVEMIKANQGVESGSAFNVIDQAISDLEEEIKSKSGARTYDSIQEMVTDVNSLADDEIVLGVNIYFTVDGIPALWCCSVEDTSIPYVYTTDQAFIEAVTTNKDTTIQVGYYKFCKLTANASAAINYITEPNGGNLVLNIINNQVITCTSKQITSMTLVLANLEYPFYSEVIFSGEQTWRVDDNFVVVNNTQEDLSYVQFNRTIDDYNPRGHSSRNATISLLFYYDNLQLYCYINETPYVGVSD